MAYRFAGRLVQDGVVKIFVTKGDTPVAVKVGDALDGYVVESIGAQAIGLVYPPLGTKASIAISAAPDAPVQSDASAQSVSTAAGQRPSAQAGAALPPSPGATAGKAARVLWDGPAQVKAGENFSLSLRALAGQAISASPMQLRFDPAVLESVAVRPGRLFASEAGRGFTYRVNPEGAIFIGASGSSVAGVGADAGAGGAELLVLVFKARKPGAFAEVSLTALNLQGQAGQALAYEALTAFRVPVTP